MTRLIYKKEYDGNPESLPSREPMPGAVQYKEIENEKSLALFANGLAVVIMVVLAIGLALSEGGFCFSYLGCLCALLSFFPHEFLHAICFREEVYLYTNWKHGMLFVIGTETMSKARFIFLSLFPNLVFGAIPYIIYLIWPSLAVFGTLGWLALSMGVGDYYNVYNTLTQVPRGGRVYLSQFHSYWYLPEGMEKDT